MSKGLIGKKLGMTRIFIQDGVSIPVTVIEARPNTVIQVKTKNRDGYEAIQLGFDEKRHPRKSEEGHAANANVKAPGKVVEFNLNGEAPELGSQITLEMFATGEKISITGKTKGKGFAGVVKRHGFSGGRASHGSLIHRKSGSIGCAATPGRVLPGHKMAGHMGHVRQTVKNLTIVDVRPDHGVILVKGAVPGPVGGLVLLKKN